MTDDRVREARLVVGNYVEPHLGVPLEDAKAVKSVRFEGGRIHVTVELGFPLGRGRAELQDQVGRLLADRPDLGPADVSVGWRIEPHAGAAGRAPLPGIANVIAVASGKGGVGKSTTAANLALALALDGARVGLLDADIYGPSQPRMMGLPGAQPTSRDGRRMEPPEAYGVKVMSIGFLVEEEQPMVWRGPMVTQALTQLLTETNWGELDYLVVDMPPGTGDIQLTLAQRVPVSGAVVVTTPQDIALLDAKKGVAMFEKVGVPILGVVENMAVHVCEKCGHVEHIFGSDGGKKMAKQYQLDYLGALPLNLSIREQADRGFPTVAAEPDGEIAALYKSVARQVAVKIAEKAKDFSSKFPTITVSKNT